MPYSSYSKDSVSVFARVLHPQIRFTEHIGLYLCNTIRVFASALVGIFLPVYIFEISARFTIFSPDPIKNGIMWVFMYFLLRSIFALVGISTLTHYIFTKWGFGKSIMISLALLIIETGIWIISADNLYFILLSGVLAGFVVATYWVPYHVFFVEKFKKYSEHYGRSTATVSVLTRLASGLGPVAGGLIIAAFGFKALFTMIIILIFTAGLPTLLIVHDWKHHDHFIPRIFKKSLANKRLRWLGLSLMGEGIDTVVYSVLWPIALFFALESFIVLGTLNAISFFVSIVTALLVGKLIDKKGIKPIHLVGILINALLYIPRILFFGSGVYYAVDILDKANSPFYTLPNLSISYDAAKKYGRSDFIIFRELALHIGIIFGVLASMLMLYYVSDWRQLFTLAIVGTLLTMFYEKK